MVPRAGEVALPGGKRDEADASDIHTALREAHEELGLPPDRVQVLTILRPVLSKHLLSVGPRPRPAPPGIGLWLSVGPRPGLLDHIAIDSNVMTLSTSAGGSWLLGRDETLALPP